MRPEAAITGLLISDLALSLEGLLNTHPLGSLGVIGVLLIERPSSGTAKQPTIKIELAKRLGVDVMPGWISDKDILNLVSKNKESAYFNSLKEILND